MHAPWSKGYAEPRKIQKCDSVWHNGRIPELFPEFSGSDHLLSFITADQAFFYQLMILQNFQNRVIYIGILYGL